MKKILFLTILVFLMCSCVQQSDNSEDEFKTDEVNATSDIDDTEQEVKIILTSGINNQEETERIVNTLNEGDNTKEYFYEDENTYYYVVTEEERKAYLEKLNDITSIEVIDELFHSNNLSGVFISVTCDELYQTFTFTVDGELFEEKQNLTIVNSFSKVQTLADEIQAYELIPIEERCFHYILIDNETGDVLYESNGTL